MGTPMMPLDLTLGEFERPTSMSFKFRSLMSRKQAELGHILLLNINRKS